jgi:hypothetical protein
MAARSFEAPLRVIVNADDFGCDVDTCAATIACFEAGALSSASIMPTMPAASLAFQYARSHTQFSFGVHLTFVRDTLEAPAASARRIPTLVDREGRLRPSRDVRLRALAGLIAEDDIAREIDAQLGLAADSGVKVSHVDSHGHLHKFPVFRRALARVLPRHALKRVRSEQNVYLGCPWRSPTWWLARASGSVREGPWRTTDWFYMPASAHDADWPERLLRKPRSGTLEIGLHPGRREPWRDCERRDALHLRDLLRERRIPLLPWVVV